MQRFGNGKGSRHKQSPDLSQTKVTPRTRAVHQAAHSGQLRNPDPNKKYVLASSHPNHPMNSIYYESMGYEVERAEVDGVRIELGVPAKIGEPLEWQGCVLLSCSLQRAQEIFESGPTGNTGQNYQDKLMEMIRKNRLEKPVNVPGAREYEVEVPDLEANNFPVYREI